ncbi:Chloroplast envelope quinone oxidoreductase-like protein [Drosera capensis]
MIPINILIPVGSGGVGHYAVHLAKLGNAHITATCGSRNLDFVRSLGAVEVLDYHTPEGATLKSPSGKKYDYVLHCATGIPWSTFHNLSSKGKVIDLTPSPSAMLTFAVKKITFSKQQLVPYFCKPTGENLEKLVEEGKVKTVVDSTYPLSKGEEAWAKLIDGHATGKIIIEH